MKNQFAFVYQATICWYEDGESHHYRIAGLGFCTDFTDAVRQLEEKEGDTLESIEHIELLGEKGDTLIDIPSKFVRPLIERDMNELEPYTKEV